MRGSRLTREWETIRLMLGMYCRGRHGSEAGLCRECGELADYAEVRLGRCCFGEEKPTCFKCPVHCYAERRREQIRMVMRYAGPRMVWRHPWLSVRHMMDGWFWGRQGRVGAAGLGGG